MSLRHNVAPRRIMTTAEVAEWRNLAEVTALCRTRRCIFLIHFVDFVSVKTVVGADLEARNLALANQSVERSRMNL